MTGIPNDASSTNVSLIQPGWEMYSKDGVLLGEVVAADQKFVHVRVLDGGEGNIEVRTDAIIEQEEHEMRARIDLTAAEVSGSANDPS